VLLGFALGGWLLAFALKETNCRYLSDQA